MRAQVLPKPSATGENSAFWIDEAIWGHRFYNEQVPWLSLLEMLVVLRSEHEKGRGFQETSPGCLIMYKAQHLLHLRNILFNNPYVDTIAKSKEYPDDNSRWDKWTSTMNDKAKGTSEQGFDYLKPRFDSFDDFAYIVKLIRSTAIEGKSNKRWTSKFAFPYGPSCLFEDLRIDDSGSASSDRRFFGRTGELTYLMLCRSGRSDLLLTEFKRLFLEPNARWNRLVGRLLPNKFEEAEATRTEKPAGYLPYEKLPEYERFADDLLALFRSRLPGYDVLPHLVDMIGLHLTLYYLRRAHEWSSGFSAAPLSLVLEIVAPKRTTVRDLSVDSFQKNGQLSLRAVERYIDEVEQSKEWRALATKRDGVHEALVMLKEKFGWDAEKDDDAVTYKNEKTMPVAEALAGLLKALKAGAKKRHQQHFQSVHPQYTKAIGLASSRGTRRLRYAPSDQFLKSLVFAVVPKRMEFQLFLQRLWERYSFVIGHKQAAQRLSTPIDQKAFVENAVRLEMRLSSLGLLRRLSDACAYVENPFGVAQ